MSKLRRITATQAKTAIPFWRVVPSAGRKKPVGKFGKDLGERGVYDKRNALNDMTGREWVFFLNSILIKAYPPVADQCGFDLRKIHPCPKPPFLMRDIILFFTKANQLVLDPFAGVGGTLLGAALCDQPRRAIGIELMQPYVTAFKKVARQQGLCTGQKMICGDSNKMLNISEVADQEFDLILTDPPYSDLMTRKKNGHKKKLYGRDEPTPFSASDRDLGNLSYEEFLVNLQQILTKAVSRLKRKKYLVVFSRDLQPLGDKPNLLHADMINAIRAIPDIVYRGMKIWHDQAADLYPFGYPYAYVMNQMHQYILIFRRA
jgi:DNA modification methylase